MPRNSMLSGVTNVSDKREAHPWTSSCQADGNVDGWTELLSRFTNLVSSLLSVLEDCWSQLVESTRHLQGKLPARRARGAQTVVQFSLADSYFVPFPGLGDLKTSNCAVHINRTWLYAVQQPQAVTSITASFFEFLGRSRIRDYYISCSIHWVTAQQWEFTSRYS